MLEARSTNKRISLFLETDSNASLDPKCMFEAGHHLYLHDHRLFLSVPWIVDRKQVESGADALSRRYVYRLTFDKSEPPSLTEHRGLQ